MPAGEEVGGMDFNLFDMEGLYLKKSKHINYN